jgi:hypothetical protein
MSIPLLRQAGISAYVISCQRGGDPDAFLRSTAMRHWFSTDVLLTLILAVE